MLVESPLVTIKLLEQYILLPSNLKHYLTICDTPVAYRINHILLLSNENRSLP